MSLIEPLPEASWDLARRCSTIARHWALLWSAIQLTVLREKGPEDLAAFKQLILRRHQRAFFIDGVKKLGIALDLPPAVIAGRYHYLSNMIGGLKMEYIEETPKKVWIRYLPPAWSFPGAALFAVPSIVQRAMFAGWHPHNGPSLGSARLGFVVTKVFQDGEPYDEGYFLEYDRDLDPDERIQFKPTTRSPDFDAARAPKLDPREWTEERLLRAKRKFAREYLEDGLRTALEIYGLHQAAAYIGHSARLCAVQFFEELRANLGVAGNKALDFARIFAHLGELAGERVTVEGDGAGRFVLRRQNRLFGDGEMPREVYEALFEQVKTAAKVLSPRVSVALTDLTLADGVHETWLIEDSKERLF